MFKFFRKNKPFSIPKSKMEFTPIPAEYKEKAWEYQQVAGLLCQDIDLLVDMCDDEKITKEEMLWFVKDLQRAKDEMISNKESRDSRYAAAYFLASIPKGCIVSTKME